MSSWGHTQQVIKVNSYYHATDRAGFCSIFLNLLFNYLYIKKQGGTLFINSLENPISSNYPIIPSTFILPKDIHNCKDIPRDAINLKNKGGSVRQYIATLTNDNLRLKAIKLFKFSPEIQNICIDRSKNLPDNFDVGIHIRSGDKITTGEMSNLPIELYYKALEKACKKENPKIFVMTDNIKLLKNLKLISPPMWSYYSLSQDYQIGHVQSNFNNMSEEVKKEAYYQFLSELYLMKKIPHIIVTFTSNIGRYLYLTSDPETKVESLDMKVFCAL